MKKSGKSLKPSLSAELRSFKSESKSFSSPKVIDTNVLFRYDQQREMQKFTTNQGSRDVSHIRDKNSVQLPQIIPMLPIDFDHLKQLHQSSDFLGMPISISGNNLQSALSCKKPSCLEKVLLTHPGQSPIYEDFPPDSIERVNLGNPTGRQDIKLLQQWLSHMKDTFIGPLRGLDYSWTTESLEKAEIIFVMAAKEVIRQVSVHCIERGEVLKEVLWFFNTLHKNQKAAYTKEHTEQIDKIKQEMDDKIYKHARQIAQYEIKTKKKSDKILNLKKQLTDLTEALKVSQTRLMSFQENSKQNDLKGFIFNNRQMTPTIHKAYVKKPTIKKELLKNNDNQILEIPKEENAESSFVSEADEVFDKEKALKAEEEKANAQEIVQEIMEGIMKDDEKIVQTDLPDKETMDQEIQTEEIPRKGKHMFEFRPRLMAESKSANKLQFLAVEPSESMSIIPISKQKKQDDSEKLKRKNTIYTKSRSESLLSTNIEPKQLEIEQGMNSKFNLPKGLKRHSMLYMPNEYVKTKNRQSTLSRIDEVPGEKRKTLGNISVPDTSKDDIILQNILNKQKAFEDLNFSIKSKKNELSSIQSEIDARQHNLNSMKREIQLKYIEYQAINPSDRSPADLKKNFFDKLEGIREEKDAKNKKNSKVLLEVNEGNVEIDASLDQLIPENLDIVSWKAGFNSGYEKGHFVGHKEGESLGLEMGIELGCVKQIKDHLKKAKTIKSLDANAGILEDINYDDLKDIALSDESSSDDSDDDAEDPEGQLENMENLGLLLEEGKTLAESIKRPRKKQMTKEKEIDSEDNKSILKKRDASKSREKKMTKTKELKNTNEEDQISELVTQKSRGSLKRILKNEIKQKKIDKFYRSDEDSGKSYIEDHKNTVKSPPRNEQNPKELSQTAQKLTEKLKSSLKTNKISSKLLQTALKLDEKLNISTSKTKNLDKSREGNTKLIQVAKKLEEKLKILPRSKDPSPKTQKPDQIFDRFIDPGYTSENPTIISEASSPKFENFSLKLGLTEQKLMEKLRITEESKDPRLRLKEKSENSGNRMTLKQKETYLDSNSKDYIQIKVHSDEGHKNEAPINEEQEKNPSRRLRNKKTLLSTRNREYKTDYDDDTQSFSHNESDLNDGERFKRRDSNFTLRKRIKEITKFNEFRFHKHKIHLFQKKTNPANKLVEEFMKKRLSRILKKSKMSKKMAFRLLNSIYSSFINKMKLNEQPSDLIEHTYNEFLQRYSMKTVCEKKLLEFIASLLNYSSCKRALMYLRLSGISEKLSINGYASEAIGFYMTVLNHMMSSKVGIVIAFDETADKIMIPVVRVIDCVREIFEGKNDRNNVNKIILRIEGAAVKDPKKINQAGLIETELALEIIMDYHDTYQKKIAEGVHLIMNSIRYKEDPGCISKAEFLMAARCVCPTKIRDEDADDGGSYTYDELLTKCIERNIFATEEIKNFVIKEESVSGKKNIMEDKPLFENALIKYDKKPKSFDLYTWRIKLQNLYEGYNSRDILESFIAWRIYANELLSN
ncbi:hypothetical protein SteCoe_4557 [Stentor coeruleus]|uniref:Uncharacterized protein n=1 Tax=Stentor coeruleus TaxID=5963 RepID=A0A1R2CUJ5_9CILI|nr:hypothetical protein SteCoe_4557 [Stentor coeruleus]